MYAENKQLSKFERDTKAAAASKSKNVKPTKTAKTKKARKASQTDALAGLGLPTRVCSALVKAGIDTKVKLAAEIKKGNKIPGIGDKSLDEIKAALK